MRELYVQEELIDTEYGSDRLQYSLYEDVKEGNTSYGVTIRQFKRMQDEWMLFETASLSGFAKNLDETRRIYQLLIKEQVFPVHLTDIIEDWIKEHGDLR